MKLSETKTYSIYQISKSFFEKYKSALKEIADEKILLFLFCILPLFMFVLIPTIYMNSVLREIPVAIVDKDRSEISSMIIKSIESAASMKIIKYCNDESELKELFRNNIIHGAFVFPQDMSENIKKSIPAVVPVFINASNLIISNNILNDATKIIKGVSGGIVLKKLRSYGLSENQAMNIVMPVKIQSQILYNPVYSYSDYLIPGVCTFIYMMIILSGTILEFHGNYKDFLAKAAGHLTFHLMNNLILTGLIFYLFKITIAGSALLFFAYLYLFSVVCFSTGIMFTILFNRQMMALQAILFVFTPAFIYSGLTFPLWAMPKIHQLIAQFIPFTSFLSGLQKIYLVNADFKILLPDILRLFLFLIITVLFSLSIITLKKKTQRVIE